MTVTCFCHQATGCQCSDPCVELMHAAYCVSSLGACEDETSEQLAMLRCYLDTLCFCACKLSSDTSGLISGSTGFILCSYQLHARATQLSALHMISACETWLCLRLASVSR